MRKFLIATLLIIFATAVAWYYLPNAQEKVVAFIGAAIRRDTGEIQTIVTDTVLTGSPQERRSVLIQELKKNIGEIKQQIERGEETPVNLKKANTRKVNSTSPSALSGSLRASEKIVEELARANEDESVGSKVADKVLDALLPSRKEVYACKEK